MGDIANMVDYDGRISADRLLRWLRRRAEQEQSCWSAFYLDGDSDNALRSNGYRRALTEMADDLERELTPPDYPEDDDDTVDLDDRAFLGRPEQE